MKDKQVPVSLKRWFLIHFLLDILVAIPLLLVPEWFLGFLGWTQVDPVASRVVAAALFAIGIESFLVQKKGMEVFQSMLTLKIIWSFAAVLGLGLSVIQGFGVWGAWVFLGIFVVFNIIWVFYKKRLG